MPAARRRSAILATADHSRCNTTLTVSASAPFAATLATAALTDQERHRDTLTLTAPLHCDN